MKRRILKAALNVVGYELPEESEEELDEDEAEVPKLSLATPSAEEQQQQQREQQDGEGGGATTSEGAAATGAEGTALPGSAPVVGVGLGGPGSPEESRKPVSFNNALLNKKRHFRGNVARTTKYTLITFLPKNLFEQYRRATNIYFLLVVILTCIPQISPISPVTSILPTAFVLLVTMLKEGFEDFKRYKADRVVNNQMYNVVDGPNLIKKKSKYIVVGNIIKLENEERVPADCVILSTSAEDGVCYVETSQLDGETNLKQFMAMRFSTGYTQDELNNVAADVIAEKPNLNLYSYKARLEFPDGSKVAINQKNLLLQGAKLRNTKWVYAIVVCTGKDTKLSLNQKKAPSKVAKSERILNWFVLGIFLFKMICVIIACIIASTWEAQLGGHWYIFGPTDKPDPKLTAVKNFFMYFVLLSYLIPMSLMVTYEVAKLIQGVYMEWDDQMTITVEEPGQKPEKLGMACKTTNLNDELARVQYIFSDKTGTLTENKMEFAQCTIDGIVYEKPMECQLHNTLHSDDYNPNVNNASFDPVLEFLMCLSLCHSAVPEENKLGNLEYQAQSPDEVALCNAARANKFTFCEKTQKGVVVDVNGERMSFNVLCTMEFDSSRRRMSVIVRGPDGKLRMYTKGADSVMLDLLADTPENATRKEKTVLDLQHFSQLGLRTLVCGFKEIDDERFAPWYERWEVAGTALAGREQMLEEANLLMERDFKLIGGTAIEDKLQDGVPEAIHFLLEAKLYVWVITGDKQETAINIGYSCKLLTPTTKVVIINCNSRRKCVEMLDEAISKVVPGDETGLVIDGTSLLYALRRSVAPKFMQLASLAQAVICCRVTPLQKAKVVQCVKRRTKAICLSIGDGANDVSMIQTAHIGIGIYGREGTQAARAADYSIRQFRHLTRLLTVRPHLKSSLPSAASIDGAVSAHGTVVYPGAHYTC
eukprot:TRINITY_DN970_c0_g1_i1.p1 TRINITY_DN970_c0_g1~~TRINITY_DN970_c0_g1_i1.p1  ORF type:complete len:935 (-),score=274.80 TRINITY_DN970_c0_g1_i1:55-2859(-)